MTVLRAGARYHGTTSHFTFLTTWVTFAHAYTIHWISHLCQFPNVQTGLEVFVKINGPRHVSKLARSRWSHNHHCSLSFHTSFHFVVVSKRRKKLLQTKSPRRACDWSALFHTIRTVAVTAIAIFVIVAPCRARPPVLSLPP